MPKAKVKKGTCRFVVEGEFLTNITRQLWADEGKPEKAFAILEAAFPTMRKSLMFSILIGEKKLIGNSSKGCKLVNDKAYESPGGNSLSIESVVLRFKKKMKEDTTWIRTVTKANIEEMEAAKDALDEEVFEEDKFKKDREYLETFARTLEETKEYLKPKPPKARRTIDNDHGWLSPAGKFYSCGYGEHILLADRLGFEEKELEKKQWMKIQRGDCHQPDNEKPSQKQRDMIFDWFTSRKRSLPWWFDD